MSELAFKTLSKEPDAVAPDGTAVRLLTALKGGSFAQFELPAGAVSHAVAHRTVEFQLDTPASNAIEGLQVH